MKATHNYPLSKKKHEKLNNYIKLSTPYVFCLPVLRISVKYRNIYKELRKDRKKQKKHR